MHASIGRRGASLPVVALWIALVGLVLRPDPEPNNPTLDARLRERIDALERRVAGLREQGDHESARLAARLEELAGAVDGVGPQASLLPLDSNLSYPSTAPPSEQQAQPGDEEARARAELEALEAVALQEPVDETWSREAEDRIAQHYTSLPIEGLYVRSALCKSTLCRVEMEFGSMAASDDVFRMIMHEAPWAGDGSARVSDDGDVLIFIAREGFALFPTDG